MATPSHVSATQGEASQTLGTAEKRWLGDLESPLSSTVGSSGRSFAEAICRAGAPSFSEELVKVPRRRFVASPVHFPTTSPVGHRFAASPIRSPSPPHPDIPEPSRRTTARLPAPSSAANTRVAPRVDADGFVQPHSRYYRRRNRRTASPPSPPTPSHPASPLPADLIGLCFNCCRPDHMAVDCTFPIRCLRCHQEGHRAADLEACHRVRSPPAVANPRPAHRHHEASPPRPQQPRQPPPCQAPAPEPSVRILARQPGATAQGHQDTRSPAAAPADGQPLRNQHLGRSVAFATHNDP
ncbi:hypothetical protein ACQ4PT_037882 [Festuca glaucescens]